MEAVSRLRGLIRRLRRARRFGVPYSRDKYWKVPSQIRINGKMIPLSLPNDHGTRIAFKDIFLDDVYGLLRIGRTPRAIIDVGAHAGLFSLYARALFPHAIIHSYEPSPAMQKHLVHQAGMGLFTGFGEAVGGVAGRGTLSTGADSVFTKIVTDIEGDIRVISIAEAIERLGGKVDLLKLDCEGCEWEILRSKEGIQFVKGITMEYHLVDGQAVADVENLIVSAGFEIYFKHADGKANGRIWARRA